MPPHTESHGVHSEYHRLELILDIAVLVASWLLLHIAGCPNTIHCDVEGLPMTIQISFALTHVAFFGFMYYLLTQAQAAGQKEDADDIAAKMKMMGTKSVVMLILSLCLWSLYPLMSGIGMLVVQLAFADKIMPHKYWAHHTGQYGNLAVKHHESDHTADRFEYMSMIGDVMILIGVLIVLALFIDCPKSGKGCTPSWLVTISLIFFWCFVLAVLGANGFLYSKATEAGNTKDQVTIKKNALKTILKAIVHYSLHYFLGLLAPLIAGVMISIIHMPVWSAYDHSLWEKYARSSYRGTQNLLKT